MKNHAIKLLPVILVLVLVGFWATRGSSGRRFEPTAARLERGRYLVEGPAHCFECHSEVDWDTPGAQPKPGKKGAGVEFAKYGMPWLVAPNITPDVETGAGAWTDEQFARAIREGIGHDGRRLFSIMPYEYFREMSDEDLASVVVYLRSIEPVRNVLPKKWSSTISTLRRSNVANNFPRHIHAIESKIGFIDECRWLERVISTLVAHVMRREPSQIVVNDGD